MMLNAVTPQRHHQQSGAGNPLTLEATSSSSVATISTSPSSSSSSSLSASSSSTTTNHTSRDHNQQQEAHNLDKDHNKHSLNSTTTNVTSSTTATATTTTGTTTVIRMKMDADTRTTEATTTASQPASPETQTTNKSPATQSKTTSHHQQSIHPNQNHYQHNNSYQSPRYNHHSHHDNSHHNYNTSYVARSSNNNQRGHNSNHSHHNHHHNHGSHNHHHQQHHHHHHHHHQQQQHNQPSDNSNLAVSSSTSTQTTETTTARLAASNQAQRQQATFGPPYYVDLHVNAGECVSLQLLDGQEQVVAGPATITMISQQQNPPVPIPVQVPPGHMIHQIADENGTLKHIILSVMDATENGSQLDSTVITLPKGSFRIDSHGELVSTSGSDEIPLTTLPQQAYFANYDGCPVAYDATTLPDSIETVAPASATIGQTLVVPDSTSYQNHQLQATSAETIVATTDKSEHEQISAENNPVSEYDQSSQNIRPAIKGDTETNQLQQQIVESKGGDETKLDDKQVNSGELAGDELANKSDAAVPETEHHMVVQGSVSDTAYAVHQPLGTEMNLINGPMAPMLAAVDGQLYGYPPCCCCCYCDPQEAASVGGEQQTPLTVAGGQQDAIIAPEHAAGTGSTGGRMVSQHRGGSTIAGLAHQNSLLAYPNPMMAPMQSNMTLPHITLGVPTPPTGHGSTVGPVVGQNGAPGGHIVDSTASNQKTHSGHSGKGGGRGSGYNKYHKMMSSVNPASNQPNDRQQPYVGGHYNQSYNNIVSGHHHHQQHYQPTEIAGSSAASFKSQTLSSSQGSMVAGSYSPIYSSYDPAPTTMANTVTTTSIKSLHGIQGGHHHTQHHHHNNNSHHHQQQQSIGSNFRSNNNSDSDNFMQRTRDQVGYGHNSGYGSQTTGVRQQHNSSNDNIKRQALNDKTSSSGNRYASANIKVISNNHLISNSSQAGGSSTQAGSVSPIRGRIKGANLSGHHQNHHQQQHNHHHNQSGGSRNSSHYNGPMHQQQHHEIRENSLHLPASTASNSSSFHSSPSSRDHSINLKSSKSNIHTYDHNAQISKHINVAPSSINSGGHYVLNSCGNNSHKQQAPSAWQQHNKSNHTVSKRDINTTAPLSATTTIASDPNDISGDHNSFSCNSIAENQSHPNETCSDVGRRTIKVAESSELLRSGKVDQIASSSQQQDSEQTNEDSQPRTSRGKQKKCQNQPITKQQTDRHNHNSSGSSSSKPSSIEVSNKVVGNSNESSPAAVRSEMDVKSTNSNDKMRIETNTTAPAATGSDCENVAARSPMKQQVGQKNQGSKRRVSRDKSSSQMTSNRNAAVADNKILGPTTKSGTEAEVSSETVIKGKAVSTDGEKNLDNLQQPSNGTKQYSTEYQETDVADASTSMTSQSSKATSDKQQIESPKVSKMVEQTQRDNSQQAKHKNKHNNSGNSNQSSQNSHPLNTESPAHKKVSTSGKQVNTQSTSNNSSSPRESKTLGPILAVSDTNATSEPMSDLKSRINDELNDDDILLLVTNSDSSTVANSASSRQETKASRIQPAISITMRTSLSENNIRSLETSNSTSSIKSTQTTPQKLAPTAGSLDRELADIANDTHNSKNINSTGEHPLLNRKRIAGAVNADCKRRGSAIKSEQQAKLSSMPQLRLLNLNCTSVTSSSVQLRWSYIPSLAEKYGIHNHHHSGSFKNSALMDHFVIESSSCKNAETNTLVSPKIVYQGCAPTCRVNQLSSEKIYHFKVRRTALLTTSSGGNKTSDSSTSGEHLVVSEILSVTLPSVQQHSSNSNQQHGHNASKRGANGSSRSNRDATSGDNNSVNQSLLSDVAMTTSTSVMGTNRANSSSSSQNNRAAHHHQVKFAHLFKQCRSKIATVLGKVVRNSLSSYSDTKFAGLLLVLFTTFAMLLAIFIHYYIVTPVTE